MGRRPDTDSPVRALTPSGNAFPFPRSGDSSSAHRVVGILPPLPREFVSDSAASVPTNTASQRPKPRKAGVAPRRRLSRCSPLR